MLSTGSKDAKGERSRPQGLKDPPLLTAAWADRYDVWALLAYVHQKHFMFLLGTSQVLLQLNLGHESEFYPTECKEKFHKPLTCFLAVLFQLSGLTCNFKYLLSSL